jgi:hypothetical protein
MLRPYYGKDMNLENKLFRHAVMTNGPLGCWCAVPGTHLALMDASISFHSDGSGNMTITSRMGGESSLDFRWRMATYGAVQCLPVFDPPEMGPDGLPEEGDWLNLPMVIEPCTTDTGTYWALHELGRQGFWGILSPLVPAD